MTRIAPKGAPGRERSRALLGVAIALAIALSPAVAAATGPSGPKGAGARAGAAFPAGPSPRNATGPTPRNPAGPPPLNAPGSFAGAAGRARSAPPIFVGNDAFFQPQPFVSVVGPSSAPVLLGGSFFCAVHDRGFATQQFFFDHLAAADGLGAEDAMEMLVDGGGVWVYGGE